MVSIMEKENIALRKKIRKSNIVVLGKRGVSMAKVNKSLKE